MHKERLCEEVATLDGVAYKFAGTFGFIEKLAMKGKDPAYIFDELTSSLLPPTYIKNTLSCALESVDGEDITTGHDDIIESFIEAAGLQDSSLVARIILTHAMIGNVKKKKMLEGEELTAIHLKSKNFLSKNLKKAGLLSAAIMVILAGLALMTSYY